MEQKPTHAYIQSCESNGKLFVVYGIAKSIKEGEYEFQHPKHGTIYSFQRLFEKERIICNSISKLKSQIKGNLRKSKVVLMNQEDIFSETNLSYINVPIVREYSIQGNYALYTTLLNMGGGSSVATYDFVNKDVTLSNPGFFSISSFMKGIKSDESLLNENLEINLVGNLAILHKESTQNEADEISEELENYFLDKGINATAHIIPPQELITFMSIRASDGLVDIVRETRNQR